MANNRNEKQSDIIIYNTDDGKARVALYAQDDSVWLNQKQLAELFATSKQNIGQHVSKVLAEKELDENSVVKDFFTTAADGKQDILIAKNYLNADEIDSLNRLVVIFLETAELRAKNRQDITMDFWRGNVEQILTTSDLPLLDNKGSVSHQKMEHHTREQYQQFDTRRKAHDAQLADQQDMAELKELENAAQTLKQRNSKGGKNGE